VERSKAFENIAFSQQIMFGAGVARFGGGIVYEKMDCHGNGVSTDIVRDGRLPKA
jgi:hypothetical protein